MRNVCSADDGSIVCGLLTTEKRVTPIEKVIQFMKDHEYRTSDSDDDDDDDCDYDYDYDEDDSKEDDDEEEKQADDDDDGACEYRTSEFFRILDKDGSQALSNDELSTRMLVTFGDYRKICRPSADILCGRPPTAAQPQSNPNCRPDSDPDLLS